MQGTWELLNELCKIHPSHGPFLHSVHYLFLFHIELYLWADRLCLIHQNLNFKIIELKCCLRYDMLHQLF